MIALAMKERPASDLSDIESRVRFEALLADLTSEFIGVEPPAIDSKIEDALRRLVEFLDVDRAALTELNDAQDDLVFTYRWMRSGLPPSYTTVAVAQLFPVAFARIRARRDPLLRPRRRTFRGSARPAASNGSGWLPPPRRRVIGRDRPRSSRLRAEAVDAAGARHHVRLLLESEGRSA